MDKETKQKLANFGRDYGDRFLAADGFAQTHPDHKYLIVEGLRELGYRVGMTGNGVNDSPALKVVPTWPGLSTIVDGIPVPRCIWCRVRSFLLPVSAHVLVIISMVFYSYIVYEPLIGPNTTAGATTSEATTTLAT